MRDFLITVLTFILYALCFSIILMLSPLIILLAIAIGVTSFSNKRGPSWRQIIINNRDRN